MSRIGRLPIVLPQGVKVSVAGTSVTVEGPKGKTAVTVNPDITVEVKDGKVEVSRKDDSIRNRSLHGLYRQLINNAVVGVTTGYSKSLTINGVGYRAEAKGKNILFTLGYATQIEFVCPEGVELKVDNPNKVTVFSIDKQKVGQVAADIRSLRGPEPYKGKGIKYEQEVIRRKAGKTAAAKK